MTSFHYHSVATDGLKTKVLLKGHCRSGLKLMPTSLIPWRSQKSNSYIKYIFYSEICCLGLCDNCKAGFFLYHLQSFWNPIYRYFSLMLYFCLYHLRNSSYPANSDREICKETGIWISRYPVEDFQSQYWKQLIMWLHHKLVLDLLQLLL